MLINAYEHRCSFHIGDLVLTKPEGIAIVVGTCIGRGGAAWHLCNDCDHIIMTINDGIVTRSLNGSETLVRYSPPRNAFLKLKTPATLWWYHNDVIT